jgi:hypothetical protein
MFFQVPLSCFMFICDLFADFPSYFESKNECSLESECLYDSYINIFKTPLILMRSYLVIIICSFTGFQIACLLYIEMCNMPKTLTLKSVHLIRGYGCTEEC